MHYAILIITIQYMQKYITAVGSKLREIISDMYYSCMTYVIRIHDVITFEKTFKI